MNPDDSSKVEIYPYQISELVAYMLSGWLWMGLESNVAEVYLQCIVIMRPFRAHWTVFYCGMEYDSIPGGS